MLICEVDVSGLLAAQHRTFTAIDRAMAIGVAEAARDGAAAAIGAGTYQDRTGKLRRSIRARQLYASATTVTWEILAAANYALFVDQPTRPHVIRARNAKTLAFRGRSGDMVFPQSVNHPGTRGYPFMSAGQRVAEAKLTRGCAALIQSSLDRIWR